MRLLSRTFEKTRLLVAFALLFSAAAPLVQYACGITGETSTTSTIVVETTGTDTAPCGVISDGVHDRLCEAAQSVPVCDGEACTTDTVEKQSVVQSQTSSLQIISALSFRALSSKKHASSPSFHRSRFETDADWSPRVPNLIPVRLRTQSFRL